MSIPIPKSSGLQRLRDIVRILREPGGCPWDIEQTHRSLIPNLLEEAYEAAEAIRSGDTSAIQDELGDLLLQPVMHAQIASETGNFDLDSMAENTAEKLIRRHPHVFAESGAETTEAVLDQWEQIKKIERGENADTPRPLLKGVGEGLTALQRSQKLQKKAGKTGFEFSDLSEVISKVKEELAELEEAIASADPTAIEDELGDLLFVVSNVARWTKIDAETALTSSNQKFLRRFGGLEKILMEEGTTLDDANISQMEAAYQQAKSDLG